MKRVLIFSLILVIFLSSCGPSGPTPTATPDPADIAVQVMLILTQDPIVIPTLPPPPTPEPTQTLLPSPTAESPTPEPSPTEGPTATPTLNPADPRASLGEPTWREKFDRDKTSFYTFNDGHTSIYLTSGYLNLTSINTGTWYGWSMASSKPRNFYMEAVFLPQTCSEMDRYGLVFRAPDYDTGYFFGVTCDGKYSLRVFDQKKDLIPWTDDTAIKTGSDQTNRLGVRAQDDRLEFFINGIPVKDITDTTFPNAGLFGAWVAAQRTPGFTVKVDEISYWTLP